MLIIDAGAKAPAICPVRRSIIATLAVFPMFAAAAASAVHRPAMWIAQKGRATAHLFGQMPLRETTQWLTPDIDEAFGQSHILWLENPEYDKSSPDVLNAVRELTQRTAVDASYSIFEALDPDSAARLDKVLEEEGLSRTSLAGKGPRDVRQWLAAVADMRSGVAYNAIPEAIFRRRAHDAGKDVRTEWNDLLEVVKWSTEAPPGLQLDIVRMTLDDISRTREYETELDSWLDGTLGPQTKVAQSIFMNYPQLHRRMSSERNAALAKRIAGMLTGGTRQFVCIGILHLVGPDSVQDHLRRVGIRVVRA